MKKQLNFITIAIFLFSCSPTAKKDEVKSEASQEVDTVSIDDRLSKYVEVKLTTDISRLSEQQKKMLPLIIRAAQQMDAIFWQQAYGNPSELMNQLNDEKLKKFAKINYGPWDRLAGNEPFIEGVGEKTIDELLKKFKSVKRVKEASLENLSAEIGMARAKKIYDAFH